MQRTKFQPELVRPIWGDKKVQEYLEMVINPAESEHTARIEKALTDAVRNIISQFEYILVVNGQLSNIQNEREIIIRLATFHTIFFVIERRSYTKSNFSETVKFAGSLVGREFAKTIINSLINNNVLIDYRGFLKLWSRFDTKAAWGRFEDPIFDKKTNTISVTIRNVISSLNESYSAPGLVDQFISGYVYGLVDEGFRALDFLFRQCKAYKLPDNPLSVKNSRIEHRGPDAYVSIDLEPPKFSDAYDQLFKFYFQGDILALRRSLEYAVKELFKLDKTVYAPIPNLLHSLYKCCSELVDFQSAREIYRQLSTYAHEGELKLEKNNLFYQVQYFLAELNYFTPSKSQIKKIKRRTDMTVPSEKEISQLESDIQNDIQTFQQEKSPREINTIEKEYLENIATKIEKIIFYYESHLLDLMEVEAKIGGEIYLDQKQKALIREYEEKLDDYKRKLNDTRMRLSRMK